MKSYGVLWPRPGVTEIEDLDVPDPGPGEMIVASECSLASPGTERNWYLNRGEGGYPYRPGYAVAGRVYALGPGVQGFTEGDRVVVDSKHAAHNKVNAARVALIPEEVDSESAAFFHLCNIGLLGARKAMIEVGESVAVIGQGLVGLLTVQMARLQGGCPVVALDIEESRLQRSLSVGADLVANPEDEADMARVRRELGGVAPAVVIEVTGLAEPIGLALRLVRRLGRVVLLGSARGELLTDFQRDVHRPGISVIGAQTVGRPQVDSRPGLWTWMDDTRASLELMRRGRLELKSLVTHRAPGREAGRIFELIKDADPGLIGAILTWS